MSSRRSATRSMSWTCSTYARLACADAPPLGRVLDQRAQPVGERLGGRGDDRHLRAERLLGARDRLVVEEGDDGLAERHRTRSRTGRTSRRSAGRRRCRRPRSSRRASSWCRPSTICRSTGSRSQAAITCSVPLRRRLEGAWTTTGRSRSVGGRGRVLAQVDPGRDDLGVGHPADRVVGADDPRAGAGAPRRAPRGGLPRMSEPRKCITDFFRLARSSGNCRDFGTSVSPK